MFSPVNKLNRPATAGHSFEYCLTRSYSETLYIRSCANFRRTAVRDPFAAFYIRKQSSRAQGLTAFSLYPSILCSCADQVSFLKSFWTR